MDCIEQLKKIGLKEINAKTKIANKRLEDILECRFNELDKTRARGFINILQREYKIDMSEWWEKYNEYQLEEEVNKLEEEKNSEYKDKNKVNVSFIDTTIKDKKYIRLFITFVVLLVLFIFYFIYNNVISDKEDISLQYTQELEQSNNNIDEIVPNIENDNLDSTQSEVMDSNATISNLDSNSNATIPSNEIIPLENADSNAKENDAKPYQPINADSNININEVVITPKSPLWIGIIDLQTYKKKQLSISNKWVMKLDDSVIMRTGHGYFDIQAPNDFDKQYIGGNNKYFLWTKENGFKEINKSDFLSFNRGQEW
ncbi:hypothetical protein CCY99_04025 [Helicobacter sp. 16-1353]|uniref:hypothetical protein n=1 Tax=Helicobacter sp. 16-1353 TaxID=2004996 RepID=UPI000DCF5FCC|nr:hypothetical protein [Helicobacter sp. 16-1353]RAX54189.1 hypothetical protein CCY99_04025 [Helicobacter sp. 16-1353]